MARLNGEPPAPASATATSTTQAGENVDVLRRRFIRQNRELAKANSSQSLKIRNLELEVSRLLSHNLELREKSFRLESELWQAKRQASGDAVLRIREGLQAKLAELGGLVNELGDAAQPQDGEVARMPYDRPPLEGQWRERQPLIESMRETAMPTISEGKHYPRRTLGADEIQAIRLSDHSSNESPDLGPPPVAHFDYEDPVKPQASPSASRSSPVGEGKEEEETLPGLSVNLETRRRRKDGQPRLEIRRRSILPQSPEKEGEVSTILKTGAKRKLADREMDRPMRPLVKDEFTFSRKPALSEAKPLEPHAAVTSVEVHREPSIDSKPQETPQEVPKPARRVLGEKSANLSPRKVTVRRNKGNDSELEKQAPGRPQSTAAPPRTRTRRVSSLPLPSPTRDPAPDVVETASPTEPVAARLAPETPAAADLFSPTPSLPSAKPEEGRAGTPPPDDLSTMSIATDGGMRPSRRARGAVNYAEPSLNAKMRRPGKQMVDAITGLQSHQRAINVWSGRKPSNASQPIAIKQEPVDDDDDAWKRIPPAVDTRAASPLGKKSRDARNGPHPASQTSDSSDTAPSHERSATSTHLSTLLAVGSRNRRTSALQPLGTDVEATVKRMEELDLYDFKESSSPVSTVSTGQRPAAARAQRRHSSAPRDLGAGSASTAGEDGGGGRRSTSAGAVSATRAAVASRRRSTLL